jgi:hypothetical protein
VSRWRPTAWTTAPLFACALAAAPLGCVQPGANTEVVVEVLTDVPDLLSVVTVTIHNAAGTRDGDSYDFEVGQNPRSGFPVRFAVEPRSDDDATFLIEVSGRDDDNQRVVVAKARSRFVPGRSVRVSMLLLEDCVSTFCTDEAQTCIPPDMNAPATESAACGPVPQLGDTVDEEPATASDERDAATGSSPDAGRDAGGDAAPTGAEPEDSGAPVEKPSESDASMMPATDAGPAMTTGDAGTSKLDAGKAQPDLDAALPNPDAKTPSAGGLPSVAGSADKAGCNPVSPTGASGCSEIYCGTSESAIAANLSSSATCASAAFACSGDPHERARASLQKVQGDLTLPLEKRYELAAEDMVSAPEVSAAISEACARCYVDYAGCADSQCRANFFACSGLPSPY